MRRIYFIALLILCLIPFVHGQNWLRDMRDPSVNFFTVQSEFNAWWAVNGQRILSTSVHGEGEQGETWKLYKRWEKLMLPMMQATHGVRLGAENLEEKEYYRQRQADQNQRAANWTYIGAPTQFDDGGGDSSTGRLNCVRFDPQNHNIIYCGAPTGGVWKSADFGATWQLLNTDYLPQIGVSDIVINPQNTNTLYIATGDIANSECLSIGVLKSTDAGATWNTTGLSFTISQGRLMARLLMSPLDSNTLFAATNVGVYKTTNGGATWKNVDSVFGLTGMEFNPANPNTIYTCGTQLYRTVDAGATWSKLTTGLPDSLSSGGFAIGVTPADTSCIYVLVSDTAINGQSYLPYNGFYRSLNAGASFTKMSNQPDNQGTQGQYDLNVAVSPVNKDVVVIGAVNSNFSINGGATWNGGVFPSHVDHHDLRFFNNSADTVFSADDGGLFISTDKGNNWRGLNNGMHIGEIYNIASGPRTKYLYLSGRQDEGTLLQDSSTQRLVFIGDGLECLIDPLNENHMFASTEQGAIGSSYNGVDINILVYNWGTGVNGTGAWNTPYALQPGNSATVYVAKDYVYKTIDGGTSWGALHSPTLPANDNLYQLLAIAPGNPNYIYAATYTHLYRSTDGGNTFSSITDGLNGYFTSLAVSPWNPREIFVGFYGTTSASLLKSVDAGSHFTNYATGLPTGTPFHPVSIAPVRNSKGALYASLAHAGGVYYRDSTMSSWVSVTGNLPNVTVDQLEIDYCAEKIRAATYGRDIWESDPYVPVNVPPTANASYLSSNGSCTDTITFTDISDYMPTSWQWYFPGGQPASSTAQNPAVVFNRNGANDTVTFIATNAYGHDTAKYVIHNSYCVAISSVSDNNIIGIYPNPNNGNFTLSVTGNARGKINLEVINSIGQMVYQSAYNKDADVMSTECMLNQVARGIYFVRITTESGSKVEKLVIGN
jgi:photosystem II stability/assembly factor-like uncharacterized protein